MLLLDDLIDQLRNSRRDTEESLFSLCAKKNKTKQNVLKGCGSKKSFLCHTLQITPCGASMPDANYYASIKAVSATVLTCFSTVNMAVLHNGPMHESSKANA